MEKRRNSPLGDNKLPSIRALLLLHFNLIKQNEGMSEHNKNCDSEGNGRVSLIRNIYKEKLMIIIVVIATKLYIKIILNFL